MQLEITEELRAPLVAISGGLGDIGSAIAEILRQAGADIALCDVGSRPPSLASDIYYGQADVSDAGQIDQWVAEVAAHFGRCPNIVVPNAAIVTARKYLELSQSEWKREIDVNLNGAYYFASSLIKLLAASGQQGRVIFIGSWAAHAPHGNLPAYCVTKAALRMLVKTLALEFTSRGILVNEVAPGYVDAGLSGRIFSENPAAKASAATQVPNRKLIAASEVARQVLYLCSSCGDQIAGATLLMDGGLSLLQGPQP